MKTKYELRIAHLYGDLMNTYGDYGNILVLQYYGKKMGIRIDSNVVSIGDHFKADDYDMAILGDGQYFEQSIVTKDLPSKKAELIKLINHSAPMLAVGEGYQLLGQSYVTITGKKIAGIGIMNHHTIQHVRGHDFVGELQIVNPLNHHHYHGFEHHQDQTFLEASEKPLGRIISGHGGNNENDDTEGAQYQNVYGTYLHSFLARNPETAKAMIITALQNKYPRDNFSSLKTVKFAPSY